MAPTTIADLTVDPFKRLIREGIIQMLSEIFEDPDHALERRDGFRQKLERALTKGETGIPIEAAELAEHLGLTG